MVAYVSITTLASLSAQQDWRLALPHAQDYPMLVWITRGQGLLMLDGTRRGVGPNNLIFIPSGHLFALDAGRQTSGLAALCPADLSALFPAKPQQLRLRDVSAIAELTGLFEAAQREVAAQKPYAQEALAAHLGLLSVFLRRQLDLPENAAQRPKASARLSAAFCARVAHPQASQQTMAGHAAALDVTPTHLTRVCKATTGRTAADILTQTILHRALSALYDSDASAKAISEALHFGSPAYFTRFIQTHTGKTPSALRKPQL